MQQKKYDFGCDGSRPVVKIVNTLLHWRLSERCSCKVGQIITMGSLFASIMVRLWWDHHHWNCGSGGWSSRTRSCSKAGSRLW